MRLQGHFVKNYKHKAILLKGYLPHSCLTIEYFYLVGNLPYSLLDNSMRAIKGEKKRAAPFTETITKTETSNSGPQENTYKNGG